MTAKHLPKLCGRGNCLILGFIEAEILEKWGGEGLGSSRRERQRVENPPFRASVLKRRNPGFRERHQERKRLKKVLTRVGLSYERGYEVVGGGSESQDKGRKVGVWSRPSKWPQTDYEKE